MEERGKNYYDFLSLNDDFLKGFPPFYTEQINLDVLQSQLEAWYRIISLNTDLLSAKYIHITDTQCMEPPFSNTAVNRSVNRYFLVLILQYLVDQRLALWTEPLSDLTMENIFKDIIENPDSMENLYKKHTEFIENLTENSNEPVKSLKIARDNYLKRGIKDRRALLFPVTIDKLCEELKEFAKLLCLYDKADVVQTLFYSPLGKNHKFHRLPDEHITYLLSMLVYNKWAKIILPTSIQRNECKTCNVRSLGIKFI